MGIYNEPDYSETQHPLAVPTQYVMQSCSTPGCTVMIRSRAGSQPSVPVCKWCESNTAYNVRDQGTHGPSFGPELSLEEFGRDLYDAIELKASMDMVSLGIDRAKFYGKKAETERLEKMLKEKDKQLHAILDRQTIAPNDMRRLLGVKQRGDK